MFSSLRSRLWLTYILVIAAVLALLAFGLLVYVVRNPLVDRQAQGKLDVVANLIARRLEENKGLLRTDFIQNTVQNADFRVLLYQRDGTLVLDSDQAGPGLIWPRTDLPPLDKRLTMDENGNRWLYTARLIPREGILVVATPRQGGLRLLLSSQVWGVLRDEFLPPFLRAGGAAFFLSVLFAFWMTRWVARPLSQMTEATHAVARGEFRAIPVKGPDEVRELARAFNEMSTRVQASQQSQKDFVANVSHELKTPLTSIQGFAQAIQDGTVDTEEKMRQAGEIISMEAGRMYRLVVDLLDLARLDAGTAQIARDPIDLAEILSRVVEKFKQIAAEARVELKASIPPLPVCVGDRDRLAQVFTNLVDNAVKYTSPGGEVSLWVVPQEDTIAVHIRDSGQGIPADDVSRVFERFFQVEKARRQDQKPGTGLGLAIARQIVQAHHGKISVISEEGKGSTFTVILPVVLPTDETLAQDRNLTREEV